MAISFSRYVDITSGVAAGVNVPARELILRIFTDNNLLPPGEYLEFLDADEVAAFFGSDSDEYLRAAFYFSFISKKISRPQKIAFARWVSVATPPRIYGDTQTQLLATWTAIENGSLGLTIGGVANTFTALDFSDAVSLAGVAAVLQTAIRTKTGTQWTAATVTYNASRGSFDFVGGDAVAAAISVQQGVGGTPIGNTLGWLTGESLIVAAGSAVETLTDCVSDSAALSDNFGSFLFIPTLDLDEITEVATWNATQNVKFIFSARVAIADAGTYYTALHGYAGTALTAAPIADEYPEELPCMILAATRYDKRNSVQNYMFQFDDTLTASVSTDATANTLDAARVNYIGVTQQAGQYLAFYQRGLLMGGATAPVDMNTYANEIWLRDAAGVAVMTLLLSEARVSANASGLSQVLTMLQGVINRALTNGTISVGKPLTDVQILEITELSDDENAWKQVQNIGYWLDGVVTPSTNTIDYELIYSKDDVVRKVTGTHVLI
jgi:hypothetical protein